MNLRELKGGGLKLGNSPIAGNRFQSHEFTFPPLAHTRIKEGVFRKYRGGGRSAHVRVRRRKKEDPLSSP
jgi:hypothetical protein